MLQRSAGYTVDANMPPQCSDVLSVHTKRGFEGRVGAQHTVCSGAIRLL